jgi:hypothetical protein
VVGACTAIFGFLAAGLAAGVLAAAGFLAAGLRGLVAMIDFSNFNVKMS